MKVIISTFGPLHLVKGASYISKHIEIYVIQGILPRWYNKPLYFLGGLIKRRNFLFNLTNREFSTLIHNKACPIPEYFAKVLKAIKFTDNNKINKWAAMLYGYFSSFHIDQCDIFHVRSGSGYGSAIKKARLNGAVILCDHSIAHPKWIEDELGPIYKSLKLQNPFSMKDFWKITLNDCYSSDYIVVNSLFVKETFIKKGFNENKIFVVYLGIEEKFKGLKNTYKIHESFKILFTGRFDIRKGALYILEALQLFEKNKIPYELNIVGNYDEMKPFLEKNKNLKINLIGYVAHHKLARYIKEADVYLFPSLCEGCAQSLMEAMLAGLPIITTSESGAPIQNHHSGIIIPSCNSLFIAEALLKLYNSEKLRTKLGTNAINNASEYTWENYAIQMKNIYELIISNKNDKT